MDIEVRIRGLMMDPATNMPIVVLKDVSSDTVMPIWVGIFEANAIAIEIEKMAAPRPMTHDLTRNLIRHMNAHLERVVITELRDDTFFALLWVRQDGDLMTIDARPSDAIALALRADCPIYVSEQVMQSAKLNMSGPPEGPTAEELRGWLEGLNDEAADEQGEQQRHEQRFAVFANDGFPSRRGVVRARRRASVGVGDGAWGVGRHRERWILDDSWGRRKSGWRGLDHDS